MTFSEIFSGIDASFGLNEFAYILDAPDSMFNAVKDDLIAATLQDIDNGELLKQISENDDITLSEMKNEIIEVYNLMQELFDSEEAKDLPEDRKEFFLDFLAALRDKCLELPDRKVVEIIYEKLDKDVILPSYAHDTDAGADIYANEEVEIEGNTTKIVKTGLKVAIPVGWELQIRPRSGMSAKTPIRIANAPGTIDSGFRGEIGVICHNTSSYPYTIHKGDRIAQFVPKICPMISWKEGKVQEIGEDRKGGFGSTGN
jgi:dUTP pyrophosphatase